MIQVLTSIKNPIDHSITSTFDAEEEKEIKVKQIIEDDKDIVYIPIHYYDRKKKRNIGILNSEDFISCLTQTLILKDANSPKNSHLIIIFKKQKNELLDANIGYTLSNREEKIKNDFGYESINYRVENIDPSKDFTQSNRKEEPKGQSLAFYYNQQRKDYLSWDEYFMAIAKLSAMRSKDPNTQVGACIISKDNRILSIGYNGTPNGYKDEYFPWQREGDPLNTKYMYVVHAERNAILNYRGNRKDFEDAKIYVDLFPCNECAKEIIQSGIKEVIYLSDKYAATNETIASKRLFDTCGVNYRQLKEEKQKVLTIKLKMD